MRSSPMKVAFRPRGLPWTTLFFVIGLFMVIGTDAQAAVCGKEGGRPCTIFERVPSCDRGLVERSGKCLRPEQPRPTTLNCGASGQRPCRINERIPSCNAGLVENFRLNRCEPPAAESQRVERAPTRPNACGGNAQPPCSGRCGPGNTLIPGADICLAPVDRNGMDAVQQRLSSVTPQVRQEFIDRATREVDWILRRVQEHMETLRRKGVTQERLLSLHQQGRREEVHRLFEVQRLFEDIQREFRRRKQAGLHQPQLRGDPGRNLTAPAPSQTVGQRGLESALGAGTQPVDSRSLQYMSFSMDLRLALLGGAAVGYDGSFWRLDSPFGGSSYYERIGWTAGASAGFGGGFALGFWAVSPGSNSKAHGFRVGAVVGVGLDLAFFWGNDQGNPDEVGQFIGFTVTGLGGVAADISYERMQFQWRR